MAKRWHLATETALSHLIATQSNAESQLIVVLRDAGQLSQIERELTYWRPELTIHTLPGWEVSPYDRQSPPRRVQAARMSTIATLSDENWQGVLLTTVAGLAVKLPPANRIVAPLMLQKDAEQPRDEITKQLVALGYSRVSTVLEPGEFAVRGGLLDVYPATAETPVRLEYFDDEIESIHQFDPVSQRRSEAVTQVSIAAASEIILDEAMQGTFRNNYRAAFSGGVQDALYAQVSEGALPSLAYHYLPLFFPSPLRTLWEVVGTGKTFILADGVADLITAHHEQVKEAYDLRVVEEKTAFGVAELYRPLLPAQLYCTGEQWDGLTAQAVQLEALADGSKTQKALPYQALLLPPPPLKANGFAAVAELMVTSKVFKLTAGTQSQAQQLTKLCEQFDLAATAEVAPLAAGFEHPELTLVTAREVLGLRQAMRQQKAGADAILHFSELNPGDFVVHRENGIGRFTSLETITTDGVSEDFVQLEYADGKLFIPVVNLDVLSRYGAAETTAVALDRLGSAAWQARKAKVKEDLLAMAGDLIQIAAERQVATGHQYTLPPGLNDSFAATFPYQPTPEQGAAIASVEEDLFSDRPMDRLVVGDVGFGKTEIAVRAAFIVAASGRQVAILCPTTLLARQHYDSFRERFAPFGIHVRALSRLQSTKQANDVKAGLAAGTVDVVIGTHALLSDNVKFKDLALLVIDEEQRFGVKHKEKLKELKNNVDVLTLTATPIPRTLQMGLSGLRSLSLITTPPLGRLPVRCAVTPFEQKTGREAILREIRRGGQVYIVTPHVEDIPELTERISGWVPEAQIESAHGQMPTSELERVMSDFYDAKFNVLISTTIVESGLDVSNANTLLVHRADRFGLAQLYQLRGRVGRRGTQAYAYFFLPERGELGENAMKRLQLLQRLEGLGGGFKLASFDLDMRGAGNLLGKQQSGHIREVGYELYSQLLAESVQELQVSKKADEKAQLGQAAPTLAPQLQLGVTYQLPSDYVADPDDRLELYRRLARLQNEAEMQEFADELVDRYGTLPQAVDYLLQIVRLKLLCQRCRIAKLDVGPQAIVLKFSDEFVAPEGFLRWVTSNPGSVQIRPDQSVVVHRRFADNATKLAGVQSLLAELAQVLVEQPDEQSTVQQQRVSA